MIRLEIEPGGIRNVDPSEVVATMIRTSARGIGANVSEGLCSHIHQFANRDNADLFCRENLDRYPVTLEALHLTAAKISQVIWA